MRRVAILGSTGSIGQQALEVVARHRDRFAVAGLAANESVELLARQANEHRPAVVSAGSQQKARALAEMLEYRPALISCEADGLRSVATECEAQVVLAATDGIVALDAIFAAISRGVDIALSNKELAVAAGELLFAQAARSGSRILPVDSEHSAVFQCLQGERSEDVRAIVLTASGGPFWNATLEQMRSATVEQALRHPTWRMGRKNTIDSATLMNKGLEAIEASRFFSLPHSRIEVVIHRQSVIHAFVLFCDGNVKAQIAAPDMRVPIGYALAYPERLEVGGDFFDTRRALGLGGETAALTFEPVDPTRFPCLGLAYRALAAGNTYPAVLSAANEEAGRAFLRGQIRFTEISALVERALDAHEAAPPSLEAIEEADRWARDATHEAVTAAAKLG